MPPGWSEWAGIGNGDRYYDYNLLVKPLDGPAQVVRYGSAPSDYATDVISRHGRRFIADAVRDGVPFLLELSAFAPHYPYTPGPRDVDKFPGAQAPRGPLFNAPQLEGAPGWLAKGRLGPLQIDELDSVFRRRAQSVQAVDRMIGAVRAQLRRLGVAENTYIVFSSDNGFHTGQRRLRPGKQTYWDHDVRVPLVVIGPGVPAAASVTHLAANVDLRPTFQELAGVPIGARVEGRSLAGMMLGPAAGELAQRDADRAPRPELGGRGSGPPARAPGQPAELQRAALPGRAVRRVRGRQPARVLRPDERSVRAAQRLRVAERRAAGRAVGAARADARVRRRAVLPRRRSGRLTRRIDIAAAGVLGT